MKTTGKRRAELFSATPPWQPLRNRDVNAGAQSAKLWSYTTGSYVESSPNPCPRYRCKREAIPGC
jgi:hypothetical protein